MLTFRSPTLEPRVDAREDAERRYEESNRYSPDAVAWLAENIDRHPSIIEIAEAMYRGSSAFDTFVDDLLAGEVSL